MPKSDKIASFSSKPMHTAEAIQFEAHRHVADAIQRRRSFGVKRAVAEVARLYQLGERRVVQYLRNEVRHPPAHEYLVIKEKARLDLEMWARRSDEEAAKARARLAEWPT